MRVAWGLSGHRDTQSKARNSGVLVPIRGRMEAKEHAPEPDTSRSEAAQGETEKPRAARPLPSHLRSALESSYQADLTSVTVVADGVAERLGLPGAAVGTEIHVTSALDLESDFGKHVLAHEAAHVVQQGAVASTSGTNENAEKQSDRSLEREAEEAAHAALMGATARLTRGRAPRTLMGFDSFEHSG